MVDRKRNNSAAAAKKSAAKKSAQAGLIDPDEPINHDEAFRILSAALMKGDSQAARNHQALKPLMERLGEDGFNRLSAIAKNQTACTCPDRP